MPNEPVRLELLVMRAEDQRVRQELLDANELGGHYVPRMEAVHVKNAARLRELIAQHGWPAEDLVGKDGAEAASTQIVNNGIVANTSATHNAHSISKNMHRDDPECPAQGCAEKMLALPSLVRMIIIYYSCRA